MIFLSKTLLNLPPKFRWRPQKFSPKAVMVARAFRVKRHIHMLWPYRFSELFSCTLSRPFFICSDELTYEAFGGCIKSCSANNVGIGFPELKSPSGFGRLLKLADLWMVLGASELRMPPNQKVPNLLTEWCKCFPCVFTYSLRRWQQLSHDWLSRSMIISFLPVDCDHLLELSNAHTY